MLCRTGVPKGPRKPPPLILFCSPRGQSPRQPHFAPLNLAFKKSEQKSIRGVLSPRSEAKSKYIVGGLTGLPSGPVEIEK